MDNKDVTYENEGILANNDNRANQICNLKDRTFADTFQVVLAQFLAMAERLTEVNAYTGKSYLSELSRGLRLAGEFRSQAIYMYNQARHERKAVTAIVALDKFPAYIATTGCKATDATREFFINQHPSVLAAKDAEAYAEAVLTKVTHDYYYLFNTLKIAAGLTLGKQHGELNDIPEASTLLEKNNE